MDEPGSSSRDAPPVRPRRSHRTQRAHRSRRSRPADQTESADGPDRSRRRREAAAAATPVQRKMRAGLTKKLKFSTELMGHLDMLVYAELCTLYYMECSLFRLLLRAVPQSLFLSPKSDEFMLITPAHRPHVLAVFVPNALCLLVHLLARPLQGTEASRGYLHGGVLIDFVGQRAPSSRWVLLLLDLVILAVQCLMLAVHTEREKLRKLVLPLKGSVAVPSAALGPRPVEPLSRLRQDLDAEERGERPERTDDMEMQPLTAGHAADTTADTTADRHDNDDHWRPRRLPPEQAAEFVLDALASGCNLDDFYIVHAIREASRDYQGVAAQSLQTMGYAASLARLATRRSVRPAAAQPAVTTV